MRKCYFLLLGLLSFIGVNTVSADTYSADSFYQNFDEYLEDYNLYKDKVDHLIDYWENNHSIEYPYYFIIVSNGTSINNDTYIQYTLYSANSFEFVLKSGSLVSLSNSFNGSEYINTYQYDSYTNEYKYSGILRAFEFPLHGAYILDSNTSPTFKYQKYSYSQGGTVHHEDYSQIVFPSFSSNNFSFSINQIEVNDGEKLPTLLSLYDGTYEDVYTNSYTEVNLNNYAYVALSLKDYEDIPSNNSSRYSNFYVKGQLCVTPVYNYGLTERKDVLTNSKMQGCSQYYDDFTLTRMYILKTDVENHAIYYFKAYDTSKDNILKVDTSIFNITYISEENKDNPEVLINNKYYPTLPYDSLTDTAIKSESEGYVSGTTCAVGDFNCYSENNSENLFDEIFSSPLNFLKSIWDSVTSIFSLIAEFINLLPVPMQSFLYLSFMIAIILGLLKILL